MATSRVAVDYVWELGIDWNAVETAGVSYLREGLVSGSVSLSGTAPVKSGDTIKFRIFDVNSSATEPGKKVNTIESLVINSKAAVKDQLLDNLLTNLSPTVTLDDPTQGSILFESPSPFCSWTSQEVTVKDLPEGVAVGRFLLTVQVQATGPDQRVRLFSHDPEMVVGPNT
jgi:hypothetical protein